MIWTGLTGEEPSRAVFSICLNIPVTADKYSGVQENTFRKSLSVSLQFCKKFKCLSFLQNVRKYLDLLVHIILTKNVEKFENNHFSKSNQFLTDKIKTCSAIQQVIVTPYWLMFYILSAQKSSYWLFLESLSVGQCGQLVARTYHSNSTHTSVQWNAQEAFFHQNMKETSSRRPTTGH